MTLVVWYLDRATALLAYPTLTLAALTGVFYNTRAFGNLHLAASRVHIEIAVLAMLFTLAHGAVGVLDTYYVVTGAAPPPSYSIPWFLAGGLVGAGALVLLVVAVLGFLDPRRFARPWGPRVVHAFAYGGFAFGTLHAAAIGTDLTGLIKPALGAALAFVLYALVWRALIEHGIVSSRQ